MSIMNELETSRYMSITGQSLNLELESSFEGQCVPISTFEKLNQLGEGTYGVVYRAKETKTSRVVALKQIRIPSEERSNGVPITALREISILRSLKHSNIINVTDVAIGARAMDEIYMVMEYAEQVKFTLSQVKCVFHQLLEGLDYLHRNDIIHRDVKMQNILLTAKGVLKLADFGMARSYSARPLTAGVVTIWYRAPELLLGTKYYTPSIDLWSAGLVLAELLQSSPLLTGETIGEQLSLIVKLLGSPTSDDIAEFSAMGCPELIRWRRESLPSGRVDNVERRFLDRTSPETINFLKGLLSWSPGARWTAAEALGKGRSGSSVDAGKWWQEFPRATDQEFLPTYPEVRNGEAVRGLEHTEETADARPSQSSKASKASTSDYLFDFDGKGILQRPMKRPRSR